MDSDAETLVKSLLTGRAELDQGNVTISRFGYDDVRSKCRAAYEWITTKALPCPYYDIQYGKPLQIGSSTNQLQLADDESYISFAVLPLLNLMTCRRLLFVGSPGRGKTTMATLMSLLAGLSLEEIRQGVQHGHPQMTNTDLLGSPLPGDLVKAESTTEIKVAWRKWLRSRVKIIDEYNRIPTKTQSTLLSLMSEGYAEMFEQIIHTGDSAWYLTANDDSGGGTFPVITALKDRIDIIVRCTPFFTLHLDKLAERIEQGTLPEDRVPPDLYFTKEELATANAEIKAIPVPEGVLALLSFVLGQLDFCRRASNQLEYQNKDTLTLSGKRLGHVCTEDCPLDKFENICSQSENGASTRSYQNILLFAKALAWFRGEKEVNAQDVRQIMPWVLFDKLQPNPQSGFFQREENHVYLNDRVAWIGQICDRAMLSYAATIDFREQVDKLYAEAEQAGNHIPPAQIEKQLRRIRSEMETLLDKYELNAPVHFQLLRLKQLHSNYQNQLSNQ